MNIRRDCVAAVADLTKPIDVYCQWIDECERLNGMDEKVEGEGGEEAEEDG